MVRARSGGSLGFGGRIFFSVVDLFGVFVPGLILVVAALSLPPVWRSMEAALDLSAIAVMQASDATGDRVGAVQAGRDTAGVSGRRSEGTGNWAFGVIVALLIAVSYTAGFVIRLGSMRFLDGLTMSSWVPELRARMDVLRPLARDSLGTKLAGALEKEVPCLRGSEVGREAPHFHFLKRLVRVRVPELWTEVERSEADMRFAAGLIPALLTVVVSAGWWAAERASWGPAVLAVGAALGLQRIWSGFPQRRIREVVYTYYAGLIACGRDLPWNDDPTRPEDRPDRTQ